MKYGTKYIHTVYYLQLCSFPKELIRQTGDSTLMDMLGRNVEILVLVVYSTMSEVYGAVLCILQSNLIHRPHGWENMAWFTLFVRAFPYSAYS